MEIVRRAVLFADVCDSTGIYETYGDAQALALINLLFARLGTKVTAHSGTVAKTLGDGMVCQFRSADAAFRAACDMQAAAVELAPRAPGKLSIKIGFTYGPVVLKGADVFGDTVNVCARLVALGSPDQVLTTQQTVDALSAPLRVRCRQLHPLHVRGRTEEIPVCDVMWRVEPDVTETDLARPSLARTAHWVLKLAYAGESFTVLPFGEARLGRDRRNEIVVASMRASRLHARLYARDGTFVIADQSSNGTFVLNDGNSPEVILRRQEAVLGERGWIGLGTSAIHHGDHVLRYRLEREQPPGAPDPAS